jgi:small subunit ribosomal protein S1
MIDKEIEEEETNVEDEGEESFAELFASSTQSTAGHFRPGENVSGTVVKISGDTIFVDLGGKSEGTIDLAEFRDKDGNVTLKEGDPIQLRVASVRKGIHLSRSLKVHGAEALETLREAQQNGMPVEGRVSGVNKGGFDVEISGIRAFCPISQMELRYCDKPEEHVGAKYEFRILELKEKGRNIIVSRRSLLLEEQEKKSKEMLATIQPGMEFEGRVTKLTDFGAFVDIGGIDGMVHVSQISHVRVKHPSDILKQGQTVKGTILKIDSDKNGRPRIALSIKSLEPEVWDKGLEFKEGEIISGTVSRLTDFGAFVEVAPGLDGLVHVSEISYERIQHPNRVLKEGDTVEALVLKIDEGKRRISLSIKEAATRRKMAEHGEPSGEVRMEVGQVLPGIVEEIKPYGIFVRLPQFGMGVRGLLPIEEIVDGAKTDLKKAFPSGQQLQVEIVEIDDKGKIRLSQKSMQEKSERADFNKFFQKGGGGKMGTLGEIFGKLKA